MNRFIVTASWLIIFILFGTGIYSLLRSISLIQAAKNNMDKIMQSLHDKDEKRVLQAEMERRKFGTVSKDGKDTGIIARILNRIDDRLVYSEVVITYPWLNASVYLVGDLVLAILVFTLCLMLNGFIFGIILAFLVIFAPYAYLDFKTVENYKATEAQMTFFINLVASNSTATSDLITLFDMCVPYVQEPLQSALSRAVIDARMTGNSSDAVWKLTRQIEYPLFKTYIRNLDICGKHDADFRSVSKDYSIQAEQAIRAMEKQKAIFANARSEVLLMVGVGILLSYMTVNFCGTTFSVVLSDMQHNLLGLVCLAVEIAIYMSTIVYLIVGRRK